ncbi:hypothetical protein [Marinimicrobium alkaliphilum]|uniref:hypothetical protein n=1 Tax=Marinimicrobium alkaliphilum TaxID=2202654 RepID=UPI000DBAB2C7|nr:hypothetical protein [Marinimicrobium alkaliphilum]
MNCVDAKSRLDTASDPQALAADQALVAHLRDCANCRDYAEELRLTRLLRALPAPPPSEGFADRALAQAWDAAQPRTERSSAPYAWGGLAASVLLAAVLFTQIGGDGPLAPEAPLPDIQVVQMAPNEVRPVNVRLVSKEALPEATITIRLDRNLALDGYPDTDTLSWQTALAAGTNELALPLHLLGDERGEVTIEIQSGSSRRHMKLAVEPRENNLGIESGSSIAL